MRRKEKKIKKQEEVEAILQRALVCRLALAADDQPYIVPMCFGCRDGCLYFHCALEGMKLDILKKNNRVCFECDVDHALVTAENACEWGMKGESVVGFGKAFFVEDAEAKKDALNVIMEHYGARGPFSYKEKGLLNALIIRVEIESMTGKRIG